MAKSGTPCDHILVHYHERISGNPPVFFIFEQSELPEGHDLKHEPSIADHGYPVDDCHCNIYGLEEGPAKKWLIRRGREPQHMLICEADGTYRQATLDEILEQYQRFQDALRDSRQQ